MNKCLMAMTLTFALGCFAQTPGSSTSPQGSNPNGSQTNSGSMQGSSGNSGSMQNGSSSSDMNSDKNMKGDKSIKGCIRQSNGMYMLEEKGGKMVNLQSSQDLSAHVGHEVKLHGMWQASGDTSSMNGANGSGSQSAASNSGSMSSGNSGSMSGSSGSMMDKDHMGQSFTVDKIDMVSDKCKMDKDMKNDSSMHK